MGEAKILLIEDNPDDIALTLRALSKNNIRNEVVVAQDGAAGLAYLLPEDGSKPLRPALTLLDINLPKVSGLELLRQVRADPRTRSLPIVVLTTSKEEHDLVESYELGANSFVRKPVIFNEFVEATRVLGVYWLLLNQAPPTVNEGGNQP